MGGGSDGYSGGGSSTGGFFWLVGVTKIIHAVVRGGACEVHALRITFFYLLFRMGSFGAFLASQDLSLGPPPFVTCGAVQLFFYFCTFFIFSCIKFRTRSQPSLA